MQGNDRKRYYSVLIVSGSEQMSAIVRKNLPNQGFFASDCRKSASAARQCLPDKAYDLVVINSPLPDEFGHELAMDIAERGSASILMLVPAEIYDVVMEQVTDCGILVISKPLPAGRLEIALRYLTAVLGRMHNLRKEVLTVEEKMEEIRIISRTKLLLVEKKHMTEDDAHRFIGKYAMDHGISRRKAAEDILGGL
ncbi:MAG: ANTAR domain-containing protein [Lachnospiraceae bacterium]|nr:ANTAR domain-containing protein [Lachnospiraceae bacterium]